MATAAIRAIREKHDLALTAVARFSRLRALCWCGDVLYASHGYKLLRAKVANDKINWQQLAEFRPAWWRGVSSSFAVTSRLCRDGFHALAVLPSGDLVGAVAGAIVSLPAGQSEFRVSHRLVRGTRPLHIACTPNGKCFWGEYFDNPHRDEVRIYGSSDHGVTWDIVYTFPKGEIRHVHNIVYDRFENCFWILTGDQGRECRILCASPDFATVETMVFGNQKARAVALLPRREAVYFSSDTPLEENHIYRLNRHRTVSEVAALTSSSISGCVAGNAMFFSTMVEPSSVNGDRYVRLLGSPDGEHWRALLAWQKDRFPMKLFQYGNAFLPDGDNATDFLAVSTIAVKDADLETTLWRVTT